MIWPEKKLRDFCRFRHGGTPSKARAEFWNGGIPWVSPKDMHATVVSDTEDHITRKAVDEDGAILAPPKSILVVVRSGILVRTVPIALTVVEAAFNQDMKSIEVDTRIATPEFVFWFLQSRQQQILTQGIKRGATVHSMQSGYLESLSMPLPAFGEQRRLVDILSQADTVRKKRAHADAMADRILPALFHHLFGDPSTNPKRWRKTNLGTVIAEAAYGTSAPSNSAGNGLPVLRMNNIDTAGRLDLTRLKYVALGQAEAERQLLCTGDLLFNRTNSKELVGKTGLWRSQMPAVAASYLIRVRVDEGQVLPDYVWAWMNTPYFKQLLFAISRRAVGMANINATELRSLPILIPDLAAQHTFAQRLRTLEGLAVERQASGEHIERLFSVLLHRAFTGDLTAKWRQAHMKELLAEMEQQARLLSLPSPARN